MRERYTTVKESLDDLNKLLIEMKCASDKWKEEIKFPPHRETFWDKMKIKRKVWRIFR